jgi:DNA polymerase III delta prime subunit
MSSFSQENVFMELWENKSLPPITLFLANNQIEPFLLQLAQKIVMSNKSIHPDLHLFKPSGKNQMHSMESILELNKEVYKPPYSAPFKVFIIFDAHKMLPTSSNALLKTLEESPEDSYIILQAPEKSALLPTIVSRASTFFFSEGKLQSQELSNEKINEQVETLLLQTFTSHDKKLEAWKKIDEIYLESFMEEKINCLRHIIENKAKQRALSQIVLLENIHAKVRMYVERGGKLSTAIEYIDLHLEGFDRLEEVPYQPNLDRSVAK